MKLRVNLLLFFKTAYFSKPVDMSQTVALFMICKVYLKYFSTGSIFSEIQGEHKPLYSAAFD
jgi:hypothetical protein